MKSKLTDYHSKTEKPELAPVMGRVRKDLVEKGRPIMKKLDWSWGDFIEASLTKLIEDETAGRQKKVS